MSSGEAPGAVPFSKEGERVSGALGTQPVESARRLWARDTVGVVLPTEFPYGFPGRQAVFRAARIAEESGFDALWVGDHILWHCPNLECLSVLGALTSLTETIVIGSAVLLLPLRNAVHVAKSVTTLDQLSGGRVALGVGVGGENPLEFAASHSSLRDRGRRTDRSLRVMKALLRKESMPDGIGYDDVPSFMLEPGVVHPPGPPLLIGGRSDAALRRTSLLGDGWLSLFVTPDRFEDSWQEILRQATDNGREGRELLASLLVFVLVDENGKSAEATASDWLRRQFGADPTQILQYAATGSPDQIVESLSAYQRSGVQHIILSPMGPDPVGQIELLGSKVITRLNGLS